ncbi:MAG: YncE family protein [Methylococcales bacterium]|nr:YncE family protein [Methylococcales bacterium]
MFKPLLTLLLYGKITLALSNPYFYINQQQGESISVFNRTDLTLKTKVPSLEGPAGIAISNRDPWFAVTYPNQGMVSFFDSKKLIPLEHVAVGGSPFGVVFANKLLFYSDWNSNSIGVINPGTGRIIKKIIVEKSPAGIATVNCESQVWVTNRKSDSVSIIDTHTLKLIKTIQVGKAPYAIDTDKHYAYIANAQSNSLSVIDLVSLSEIKRIKTGRMPYGVAVDKKQHKVYVSNQLANTVSVIDSRTHKIIKTLQTGEYPENIAVDEKNQRLLVLNWFDGDISVFDNLTNKEIKRIKVADGSRAFGAFVGKAYECSEN